MFCQIPPANETSPFDDPLKRRTCLCASEFNFYMQWLNHRWIRCQLWNHKCTSSSNLHLFPFLWMSGSLASFSLFPSTLSCSCHLHFPSIVLIDGWMRNFYCITAFTRKTLVITPRYEIIFIRLALIILISSSMEAPFCYIYILFLTLRPGDWLMIYTCMCGPATSLSNVDYMGRWLCHYNRLDLLCALAKYYRKIIVVFSMLPLLIYSLLTVIDISVLI